jgi:predicted RecB family nuclease
MIKAGSMIQLSATDLVGHLNCRHLTQLDLAVVAGELSKPKLWDPLLEVLAERGAQHEKGYIDHLKAAGFQVAVVDGIGIDDKTVAETVKLMKAGAPIIAQAALRNGHWAGRADILRRVETPSQLGAWSYEPVDAKLARETRGGTVLQLCLYCDLIAAVQGAAPEYAHVVVPWSQYQPQTFRILDYAAYYRRVKISLEAAVNAGAKEATYPDPKDHCEICRWRVECDTRRRADDHLCLVAGLAKSNTTELKKQSVETVAQLAAVPLPLPWKPDRGAAQTYVRLREQARLQVEGRLAKKTVHECLPIEAGFGLTRLPAPTVGDVFLDLEGDPFAGESGLEFLFGYAFEDQGNKRYVAHWALTRADEKAAFEAFIDFVVDRLSQYPDLHIFHFAPYEPAALKRLMGRYASREDQLDNLLRAEKFVDLYAVVRHAVRASVESYSIKKLEPLYAYTRQVELIEASKALAKAQACLEIGDTGHILDADRAAIEGYNRDDCLSTWALRDWLESERAGLIAQGKVIDRPVPKSGEADEELSEWQRRVWALIDRLTGDVPADKTQRSREQHARWLLAYILDFHRREKKAAWWEYFRLRDLSADDLLEERCGLGGLVLSAAVGGTPTVPVHRYTFPPQETALRGGEALRSVGGEPFGKIEGLSIEERWVDIKKRKDTANLHPAAVFEHEVVGTDVLAEALARICEHVADHGIVGNGPYQAARDLLMVEGPRLGGQQLKTDAETAAAAAIRVAPGLQGGVLPIQGPPGAGKTYAGGRMICGLVQAGKTVGVTANSHKVIRNLLNDAVAAAAEAKLPVKCIQKVSEKESDLPQLSFTLKKEACLGAIGTSHQVGAGTAWFWARPDAFEAVEVLFIDEAAQMSLAYVLAVSHAAKTVVLLGDPRQLEQPLQGSHPDGTDVSALDHMLDGQVTIPADRGLFLEETWRLHPAICAFTSELFYENRLRSRAGLEQQEIRSSGRIKGSGLRFLPVTHEGNQSSSPEEAAAIDKLVKDILDSKSSWIDGSGVERLVTLDDILIIAPYNAQVFELQDRIKGGRVGTVDKFQGQQAAIVIYSMTTSSHADAPRGMEFLYSANRLNVATSRARCVCVIVGTTAVFEAECRTPRQMQLANGFCRYLEMAVLV